MCPDFQASRHLRVFAIYKKTRAAHDLGLTGALSKLVWMGELESLLGCYL